MEKKNWHYESLIIQSTCSTLKQQNYCLWALRNPPEVCFLLNPIPAKWQHAYKTWLLGTATKASATTTFPANNHPFTSIYTQGRGGEKSLYKWSC